MTDQGFVVKKDLAVGGNILTLQGSVIFGYGWTGSADANNNIIAQSPPFIDLLYSNVSVKSGSSPPIVGMKNQAGQIFFNTTNNTLYIWTGSTWVPAHKDPAGGSVPKYDTLFLVKGENGYSPAHMNLGNVFSQTGVHLLDGHNVQNQLTFRDGTGTGLNFGFRNYEGIMYVYGGPVYGILATFSGSGALTLAGGITVSGSITTLANVPLTLNSGSGGIWTNNDINSYGNIFVRRTSNGVIGFYDANGNNERCSLGFATTSSGVVPANATYLHNKLANGLCLVSDSGNVVLAPISGTAQVIVAGGHEINPQTADSGRVGNSSIYWMEMYARTYRYKTAPSSWDSLPDLELIKNYTTKTIKVKCSETGEEIDKEVIDMEKSLPHLVDAHGFHDSADTIGFAFGCLKFLVHRVEALEAETAGLKRLLAEKTAAVEGKRHD